jgi:uncharacterized membrane protein YkoI
MKKSQRRLIAGTVAGAALVGGSMIGIGSASAAVNTSYGFTGSVAANGATGATLHTLATQTAAQASAAATAAVPGAAGPAELIYDNGSVVYRVIVTGSDGTRTEVIVDAGNGTVLADYAPNWSGTIGDNSAGTDSDALSGTAAATPATTTTPTTTTTPATGSTGFTGSILSNGATGTALRALATQTNAQASAAATAAVPGTAGTPELIYDNGYVVFRVIVTGSDGTRSEVIVDAGNGTVLTHYTPNWSGTIGDNSAGTDSTAI